MICLIIPSQSERCHNILQQSIDEVKAVHEEEDLSPVKIGAHDEIFQAGKPVLAGVDVYSTYCYLLTLEESRDADTWAIRLLELQNQGLYPIHTIADGGKGIRAGQAEAWLRLFPGSAMSFMLYWN